MIMKFGLIIFVVNCFLLINMQYTAMSSEKEPKLSDSSTSSATTKKSQASKDSCRSDDSENLTCERFTKDNQGIIYDKNAGLEWYPTPEKDSKNMDLYNVNAVVHNFTIGGGGWRLPRIEELKDLYKATFLDEKKCSDLFFEKYFYPVWSSDDDGPSKTLFFSFGNGAIGSFPRTERCCYAWGVRARSR